MEKKREFIEFKSKNPKYTLNSKMRNRKKNAQGFLLI